jgi:hypothetical protein
VKWSLATLFWILTYLTVLAAVAGLMFRMRSSALAVYGTPEAQAEWDAWREDAKRLAEESGPVKRRVPRSAAPPALVLMRDHFGVCLGLAVVLSTVLFGTLMLFVRGAAFSGNMGQHRASDRRPAA